MAKRVEVDAEVLSYLIESVAAHNVLIQSLLGIEELRSPGFSDEILKQLDTTLGKSQLPKVEGGWVTIRSRLIEDLKISRKSNELRAPSRFRGAVWHWLTGWRAEQPGK